MDMGGAVGAFPSQQNMRTAGSSSSYGHARPDVFQGQTAPSHQRPKFLAQDGIAAARREHSALDSEILDSQVYDGSIGGGNMSRIYSSAAGPMGPAGVATGGLSRQPLYPGAAARSQNSAAPGEPGIGNNSRLYERMYEPPASSAAHHPTPGRGGARKRDRDE